MVVVDVTARMVDPVAPLCWRRDNDCRAQEGETLMSVDMSQSAGKDLLGNVLHLMQEMTPRDINALRKLKEHNLMLLEVKITAVSASLGMALDELHLPAETQVLTLLRDNTALFPGQWDRLRVGDILFLLTSVRHEAYIRQVLTSPTPILLAE
jgi:NhaP-type Na+/H+ and K+/H+ antiporter